MQHACTLQVLSERLKDINSAATITALEQFLLPEEAEAVVQQHPYSFVVDCIDSVAPKVELITAARKRNVPIVSAMGAGGKVNPALVEVRRARLATTTLCTAVWRPKLGAVAIIKQDSCSNH